MIASPSDSAAATSLTVVSVMWPAGTMTQTERGASSFEAMSSSERAADRALVGQVFDRVGVDVVDDALVPVSHQPPHEVGAHATQADHSKLCHSVPFVRC